MSERAEELVDELALILAPLPATYGAMNRKTVSISIVIAEKARDFIDAELRKERERCADRFRVFHAQMAPGSECSVEEICAAILKEEP